ncbi:MAG TPA: ribosomal protein S18-alanine N-acetyltransferase [Candidatus Acidoferrales bacterium]|nr:ribosomal protein S18-alanine N-acetyltransferase [Candidatus Acidoferrales bacterium]
MERPLSNLVGRKNDIRQSTALTVSKGATSQEASGVLQRPGLGPTIRHLESRDIAAVLEVQAHCCEASQWSRKDYETLLDDAAPCFVLENIESVDNDGRIAGFLAARKLADEMEILNLAVAPSAHRQGVATRLLSAVMKWAAENGIAKVHLEVRASNAPARSFYESRGFRAAGLRPNYYPDPTDDALLLTAPVHDA